jgi:hypothetical protein
LDNLANSKTKQAIDKLLHLLKGRGAVSLEEMYTLCGCGYDALAGALSSLIEREGIRIGRIKTRRGWLVDINEGPASPQSGIVWYSERGQLRKILPKLLKELKKYTRTEEESPEYRDNGEIIKTITHLLSDGRPRSKTEIIAETGIEDFPGLVWRHFPRLPDGRFTLPDSSGAWDFLLAYLKEKPRRLPGLLRVFQRHKMITEKLAANNDTAPFVRLTGALITTVDNPEGRLELERRRHQEVCRKTLDSLGFPFFLPEELGLNQHAYKALADSRTLPVKFDGKEYRCLRREFPGEVLIEQLGEISGRYFAPPYTASAPSFLKEHSLGVKEVANLLGLEQEILTGMAEAGEIDHFYLDNRIRFWSSDIQALRKDGSLLQKLAKRRGKLNLAEAAAFLGISIGQIRRLIDDNLLTPVLPDRKNNVYLLRRELEEIQPRLAAILPKYGPAAGRARKQAEIPGKERPSRKKRPVRRDTAPLAETEILSLDDFQIEAAEALREGLSVLVAAPTGNGKTLVAEMLARDVISQGRGMVYTSPLKALSNQKFRDFKELFGAEKVGLVTGDISINPGAPMLIMTTEIFRNWCISEPAQLEKISYVVFDEIHYLDDTERGTTWEESILFAPAHVKILGLSATVPNADEMADWISSVRGGDVVVIVEKKRRVPLAVQWILPDGRIVQEREARSEVENLAEQLKALRNRKRWMEE